MPLTKPCTTAECQEAALAAMRADRGQQGGVTSSAGTPETKAAKGAPSNVTSRSSTTAADSKPIVVGASLASPPGTPGTPAGRQAGTPLQRAPGGSGDATAGNGFPASPNRTVRFTDEEDERRDNLHVGLSSRTSSADSLHQSYSGAVERKNGPSLPPSAGGFHVLRTAGGKVEAVSSSARWEDVVGYSRAVKRGPFIFVSGTSAVDQETGRVMFRRDPYKQTQLAFTIIEKALAQVGASLDDVVRTRLFVRNMARDGEGISRAHGIVLGHVKPASTMVEVSRLVHDDILVLVEADAIVGEF